MPPQKSEFKKAPVQILLFMTVALWVVAVVGGMWKLILYSNTPGQASLTRNRWPANSRIPRAADQATLLVFAHPRCPCSKASVGELERLMPHLPETIKTYVIFYKPKNETEAWVKDKLWQKVLAIPGVIPVVDEEGLESDFFDAQTSGQTFLYNTAGELVFRGGITPERGHMGDSDGRKAIISFAETGVTALAQTSVFGCSIKNPERALAGELNENEP